MNNDHSLLSKLPEPLFVAFSLLAAYLFCEFILFGGTGVSVPLYFILLETLAVAYLSPRGGLRFSFGARMTGAACLLLALFCFLYDNGALRFFNLAGLAVLLPLHFLYLSGMNEYPFFCIGTLWDGFKTCVIFPFANFGKSITVVTEGGKRSKGVATFLKICAGVLLICPVAALILALLMHSDAAFSGIVRAVIRVVAGRWLSYFGKFLVALVLTFPLFSLLFTLGAKKFDLRIARYEISKKLRAIDVVFVNAALWVICMIYALYISTQLAYFFSGFRNTLPGGFTYAAYARRGFFELVAVVFINFCLIVFALLFSRRRDALLLRSSRVTILAMSLFNILLIATAASKMGMYIGNNGLTPLRVYASWFMLLLLVVFILLIIRMFSPRFAFLRGSAVAFLLLWAVLNLSNIDACIPRYNIAKYRRDVQTNASASLDYVMFDSLSDSMLRPASALADDPVYGAKIRELLQKRLDEHKSRPWQDFSLAGALGDRAAGEALKEAK